MVDKVVSSSGDCSKGWGLGKFGVDLDWKPEGTALPLL